MLTGSHRCNRTANSLLAWFVKTTYEYTGPSDTERPLRATPEPESRRNGRCLLRDHLDNAGQKVAPVKLLRYLPEQDAIIAESFRRETDALRRLEHPNIVKLIEAGKTKDRSYVGPRRLPSGGFLNR
jgi:serine/threonine protein kinase